MQSKAATVSEYLDSLPPDRRQAIAEVRRVILENLPPGYQEGMLYGMIGYYVPFARLAETYNGQPLGVAALASQKQYMSLYLCVYMIPERQRRFEDAYRKAGKRLDMGKSCVRFKKLDDLPLDVIGRTIAEVGVDELVDFYQASRAAMARRNKTKTAAKKTAKATARRTTKKQTAAAKRVRASRRK